MPMPFWSPHGLPGSFRFPPQRRASPLSIVLVVLCSRLFAPCGGGRTGAPADVPGGLGRRQAWTITVLCAGRVAFVEIPGVAPVFVANIPVPSSAARGGRSRRVGGCLLAMQWPAAGRGRLPHPVAEDESRGVAAEGRYHHQRRLLILLLVRSRWQSAFVVVCPHRCRRSVEFVRAVLVQLEGDGACTGLNSPMGCLSLALILLAVRGMFSGWSKRPDVIAADPTAVCAGAIRPVWSAMLTILACTAPFSPHGPFCVWLRWD